ncbi:nose resistant to fluoxetine protein 6 [Ceratitis capitata]|uniref:nose resistant to fluoxetine protein 6 n=1 Tax=Ceratitis capitata TaxID=7213 RepID=UPI0003297919|nr:nose resistant to fluoxetine protein 6 [Ceratitis capitata]
MRTVAAVIVSALLTFAVDGTTIAPRVEQVLPAEVSLARLNFLIGVAQLGALHENGTCCGRELETLLKAVAAKEFWSLKVLDSFGVAPKSFNWGNYFWFAPQWQCNDLNTPYVIAMSADYLRTYRFNPFNVTSPVRLRLTMVYMRFSTPRYIDVRLPYESIIHIGLCLPQSCSVASLRRYTDEYFQRGDFMMQREWELQMHAVAARVPSFGLNFFQQTGTLIAIVILTTLVLLIALAEIVHRSEEQLKLQQFMHTKAPIATTKASTVHMENFPVQPPRDTCAAESSTTEELLLCFRLSENFKRALQLEPASSNSNFLCVIAGVRSIICLWVSTFHVYYYSVFALSNAPMLFVAMGNFLNQPLLQAIFFVDVFFVISALLLVYNFLSSQTRLKEIRNNNFPQNIKLFGRLLLQRYLRLTPMLIITMVLTDVIYDLINTYSPFYLGANSGYYCKQRWWHNVLYIQNFLDMKDICCSWTWYLACEMQFYILITALLFLYAKSERFAKISFVTLVVGFPVVGWLCNYYNDITFDIDKLHSTLNQLYVKPWVRINPYLGGALCGWLLHNNSQRRHQRYHNHQQEPQSEQQQKPQPQPQTQTDSHVQRQHQQQQQQQQHVEKQLQQNQLQQSSHRQQQCAATTATATADTSARNNISWWHAAFWLFIALVYAVANFMSYWRNTPTWLVATIMSFGKLLFALSIGGGILICAWGHGGRLNALLSARFFRLLNKFCYSIYLLTPVITLVAYGLRNEPTSFNEAASGSDFIAVNVVAVLSSCLSYVLVELPVQRVCNKLLHKRR